MTRPRSFPWYLLTGLLIGLTLGVLFAWLISPIQYVDTEPSTLREDFKEQYRALIAASYAANGDLARAQARLNLLADLNIGDTLAAQAQRALATGASADEVRALAQLSAVAQVPPASVPTAAPLTQFPTLTPTFTETPSPFPSETPAPTQTVEPTETASPETVTPFVSDTETIETSTAISGTPPSTQLTPTPSRTPHPTATNTPPPTLASTATPASPFILEQRSLVCEPLLNNPLLIVNTLDENDRGVPGVEIILNWPNGEEHFFTGLKPELGLGYADFAMTPDITYTLRLADGSQLITDLTAAQCETDSGETIWGSWELIFIQP